MLTWFTALQMEKWTSYCYKHFKLPPDIIIDKGIIKYRFVCLL